MMGRRLMVKPFYASRRLQKSDFRRISNGVKDYMQFVREYYLIDLIWSIKLKVNILADLRVYMLIWSFRNVKKCAASCCSHFGFWLFDLTFVFRANIKKVKRWGEGRIEWRMRLNWDKTTMIIRKNWTSPDFRDNDQISQWRFQMIIIPHSAHISSWWKLRKKMKIHTSRATICIFTYLDRIFLLVLFFCWIFFSIFTILHSDPLEWDVVERSKSRFLFRSERRKKKNEK